MFLQISPLGALKTSTEKNLDNQLLFILLELVIAVFAMFKIAKFLSKIKTSKKTNYTS